MKNWEDVFVLIDRFGISGGFGDIDALNSLSRLFFQDEKLITPEICKILTDDSKIYRFEDDFTAKAASFKREEIDLLTPIWREDKYWKAKNYEGMRIWVYLYGLYDLCKIAVKEDKNLFLVEKNHE